VDSETGEKRRFFCFQCQRYVYDPQLGFFVVPENALARQSCAELHGYRSDPVSDEGEIQVSGTGLASMPWSGLQRNAVRDFNDGAKRRALPRVPAE